MHTGRRMDGHFILRLSDLQTYVEMKIFHCYVIVALPVTVTVVHMDYLFVITHIWYWFYAVRANKSFYLLLPTSDTDLTLCVLTNRFCHHPATCTQTLRCCRRLYTSLLKVWRRFLTHGKEKFTEILDLWSRKSDFRWTVLCAFHTLRWLCLSLRLCFSDAKCRSYPEKKNSKRGRVWSSSSYRTATFLATYLPISGTSGHFYMNCTTLHQSFNNAACYLSSSNIMAPFTWLNFRSPFHRK
jgi:hypothetical protein